MDVTLEKTCDLDIYHAQGGMIYNCFIAFFLFESFDSNSLNQFKVTILKYVRVVKNRIPCKYRRTFYLKVFCLESLNILFYKVVKQYI